MASGGLHMDIDGDNSSEPTAGKSSRFHIFKSIRRYISKKRNKRKDEVMVVSVKSKSTSDMLEAQDCETWKQRGISVPHNAGLSMSHDSIFTPDIHGTADDGDRRMQETALSLHDIRDELFMKINMRQGSDDEDIGFPHSPHTLPTTADILEQGLKDPQLAKSHSTCSDASLLSMSSSELDEESSNLSPSQQSSKVSLFTEPQNDEDVLEAIPLQHNAAHHRIAVKPRNRRKSMGNRRQKQNSGNLPVTPEVNEELLRNVTENHQETSISLELRDDSALASDDGLSPTSASFYSESFEKVTNLDDDESLLPVSQVQPSEIPKKNLIQKLSLETKYQHFLPNIDKTTEKSNLSSKDSLDFENNSQIVMRTSWQNLTAPREKDIANLETRKNQSFPHGQKPHYAEEIQLSNESSKKEENRITKIWRKYNKKPDGETNSNKDKSTKNIFSRIFSKNSFRKPKKNISDNSDQNSEISHSKSESNMKVFHKSNSQLEKNEEQFTQSYPPMPMTKGLNQKSVTDIEKELSKENAKKSKVVKRSISVKKDDIFYRKKSSDANKNASIKSAPEFVNETYSPRARLNSSTWKEMKCDDNKFDEEGELYKVFARRSMKLKELELLESGESVNSGDTGKTTNPLFEDDAKLLDNEKTNSVLNRVSLFEKTASHWDEHHSISNSRTVATHNDEGHLMSNSRTVSTSDFDEHHSAIKSRTVSGPQENERHSSTKSRISPSQDNDYHSFNKSRTGSVSPVDELHSITKSRTGSVSQDDERHFIIKNRTGSVSQDDERHSIIKNRTGSMSQDDEIHSIIKNRTGSVSQDDERHSIIKNRTGSVSQDERHSIRKNRTGSVSPDDEHQSISKNRTSSGSQNDELYSLSKSRTVSVLQDNENNHIGKSRTISPSQDNERDSINKNRTVSISQDDEHHSLNKNRTVSVSQDDEHNPINTSKTVSALLGDEYYSVNNRTVIEFSNVSNNILSQENKSTKEKPDIITFINHKLKQIEKNRPIANVPTLENPYPTWVRVAKQKQKQREEHVEKLEKQIQNKQSNLQKYEEDNKKLQSEAKESRSEKTKLTEESFLIEKLRPWEPKATEYIIQGSPLEVGLPSADAFKDSS